MIEESAVKTIGVALKMKPISVHVFDFPKRNQTVISVIDQMGMKHLFTLAHAEAHEYVTYFEKFGVEASWSLAGGE